MGMRLALQNDLTFIGRINPRQDFDKGALAAAVLPRQAVDFGRVNGETDVGEGAYPAEALANAAHLDEVGRSLLGSRFAVVGYVSHGRIGVASTVRDATNKSWIGPTAQGRRVGPLCFYRSPGL